MSGFIPNSRAGFIPNSRAGFALMPKPPSNNILRRAVAAWKAGHYQPNIDSLIDLTGRGHHARFGSAIGADTNDPVLLSFDGRPYLFLPGYPTDLASTPVSGLPWAATYTGDRDIRVQLKPITPGTWSQPSYNGLINLGQEHIYLQLAPGGGFGYRYRDESGAAVISGTFIPTLPTDKPGWLRVTHAVAEGIVRFYQSHDGEDWTLLGESAVAPQATLQAATTGLLSIGDSGVYASVAGYGSFYRVQVRSGIDGPVVADFNPADSAEPHTSWVSKATGETWTITRSPAANTRKAALVDRPLVLLDGVDDFLSVEHHADFNFASDTSFTVVAAIRTYRIITTLDVLSKKQSSDASHPGFRLIISSNGNARAQVSNGTDQSTTTDVGTPLAVGRAGTLALVGDRSTGIVRAYTNGVLNHQASFMGDVANNRTLHIGVLEGSSAFNGEFIGAAIFREALTPADLALVAAELGVTS